MNHSKGNRDKMRPSTLLYGVNSILMRWLKKTGAILLFSLNCFGQIPDSTFSDTNAADKLSHLSKANYDSLTTVLLRIGYDDQYYRNQIDEVIAQFGGDSNQMKALFRQMKQTDSLNFIDVDQILTRYGWLSSSRVGPDANRALFMVIQHADLEAQEKYVPMMAEAVEKGALKASSFALLQDRMALMKGKKQIYGSQVARNMKTNRHYVMAIENPDQVDQRRAKVGLPPIAVYILDCCNLVWNLAAYKKNNFSLKAKK